MFDAFIFAGVIFLVSRKLAIIFRHRRPPPACYREIHYPDKINFPI